MSASRRWMSWKIPRRNCAIAELLPHIVWTATSDGNVDFSNQRWREYAGERSWIEAIHPDDRDSAMLKWSQAIATKTPVNFEVRLAGRAGYRTFIVKATPIVHGDAFKWLGAGGHRRSETACRREGKAGEADARFFLNALSHDLRAPLHNVLLNAQLLKMSATEQLDVESLTMIVENAIAAGDLVSKLLDFAASGAGAEQDVSRSRSRACCTRSLGASRRSPSRKVLSAHAGGC